MNFELEDDHRMLRDLVQKFVRQELMPLEAIVLAREANGQDPELTADERGRIDLISKELGLWSLDAPVADGGMIDRRTTGCTNTSRTASRTLAAKALVCRFDVPLATITRSNRGERCSVLKTTMS